MVGPSRRFSPSDVAQQAVGGFLLAGPFVVTEEVWVLAENMAIWQALLTVGIVFAIGYGALYKADTRDPDREEELVGVPTRFLSLMLVSYGSVTVLALTLDAPWTFLAADLSPVDRLGTTLTAISTGAIFSVVGAATADSLF